MRFLDSATNQPLFQVDRQEILLKGVLKKDPLKTKSRKLKVPKVVAAQETISQCWESLDGELLDSMDV